MKNFCIALLMLLTTASVFAQVPQKISYQSVIRNNSNALIVNSTVGMKVSLLQGGANGLSVYTETHRPTTNANGLVSLAIGTGTVVQGVFSNIDWSTGSYFVKTEIDPTGGVNYTLVGTSELLSVPYALYASKSGSGGSTGGGTSPFKEEVYMSDGYETQTAAPYVSLVNPNIQATSVSGRNVLFYDEWENKWSRMPNSAFNVSSPAGIMCFDGNTIQGFKFNDLNLRNEESHLYINKFGGNLAVGFPVSSASTLIPKATLTVRRASNFLAPDGTAAFEGSLNVSHFNYGVEEDTYLRGGIASSKVVINDLSVGDITLGKSYNKVAVNPNGQVLSSAFTVYAPGANSTAEFYPANGPFNAALNCGSVFNYVPEDSSGKKHSTFIRGGMVGSKVWLNDAHNGDVILVNGGGNVGIGTINPTYKLSVNGGLRAKEIRVDADWADFVFEKDYKLRPLSEVEKYILEHKHLPEIPAAKEIEGTEGGLNVGEISKLFMQKIEELTLYMIEANKQIEAHNKQIEELKKENEELKSKLIK